MVVPLLSYTLDTEFCFGEGFKGICEGLEEGMVVVGGGGTNR